MNENPIPMNYNKLTLREARRLLNVASALMESPNPKDFTMYRYMNDCGTPACALGHYASRKDLQKLFYGATNARLITRDYDAVVYRDDPVLDHFGIDYASAEALFSSRGCDMANTPRNAALYIRRFVRANTTLERWKRLANERFPSSPD